MNKKELLDLSEVQTHDLWITNRTFPASDTLAHCTIRDF